MRLIPALFFSLLLCVPAFAAAPPAPDDKSRCEVCGMFVAPFPQWVSTLEMTDGKFFYFDGPKDMFIFYRDLAKYRPGATYDQVTRLYVTEYYTAQPLAATEVFFVEGSNVGGPMGMELVPVAGRAAAETFLKDHAGTKLLRFDGREFQEVAAEP
jgi:nitrous oxide reductase accessory protein NosL